MPTASEEIPLLPLPAVLFPGTFLPVQIGEDTHRALLRECVDDGHHLGVILTPGQSGDSRLTIPCTTGCLASVALLIHEGDDAHPVNAVLYGERRMRVLDYVKQNPYLTGHVELIEEYSGLHAERRTREAARLFQQYLTLISQRYQTDIVDMPLPNDPTLASYLLATVLSLPLEIKQRWLESSSAALRLEEEVAFLRAECELHEAFLAIARHAHRSFTPSDVRRFLNLISLN